MHSVKQLRLLPMKWATTVTAVFTASGLMARRLSALRHNQRIIALTHRPHVVCELALIWAVEPLLVNKANSTEEMLRLANNDYSKPVWLKKEM